MPHPDDLIRYNEAVPSAAERIITMAEKQAAHRQDLEKRVVCAQSRNSLLGIAASLILSVCIVVAGVYCILEGHDTAGGAIVSIDIVGLVFVYLKGTSLNRADK